MYFTVVCSITIQDTPLFIVVTTCYCCFFQQQYKTLFVLTTIQGENPNNDTRKCFTVVFLTIQRDTQPQ